MYWCYFQRMCLKQHQINYYCQGGFSLRRKCPDTEFFLVRISPYPVQIRENTDQKKTPYLDTFYAVFIKDKITFFNDNPVLNLNFL